VTSHVVDHCRVSTVQEQPCVQPSGWKGGWPAGVLENYHAPSCGALKALPMKSAAAVIQVNIIAISYKGYDAYVPGPQMNFLECGPSPAHGSFVGRKDKPISSFKWIHSFGLAHTTPFSEFQCLQSRRSLVVVGPGEEFMMEPKASRLNSFPNPRKKLLSYVIRGKLKKSRRS
jgi:hypothetical protein